MIPTTRIYAFLHHIKRTAGPVATCLLLWLITGFSSLAQHKLPDSIPSSQGADTSRQEDTTVSKREPATFRRVPDSVILRLKKDRDFAYANDPAYWAKAKENPKKSPFLDHLFSSRWFEYSIYFLLAAILVYALYKIISENNLRFFYRKGATSGTDDRHDLTLEEEDPDEGLTRAMTAGDHRLAVRYLYLKTLRLLDAKELIQFHPQATNQEYVNQLRPLPQGEAFCSLTGAYERVWYGDFAITGRQFERLLQSFQDFYKSISAA